MPHGLSHHFGPQSLMGNLINHRSLQTVMSREARQLRDDIFNKAIEHGTAGMISSDVEQFVGNIIQAYNPIVWERAVMYAHKAEIWDAFMKITSSIYKDQQDAGREARGNKGKVRRKDVDWLSVAISFPDMWWVSGVQNRRNGSIVPCDLDTVLKPFEAMYRLYTGWLISDFGIKTLFGIFDVSKRYSTDIVKECMDMVDEVRGRSFEYLMAIIDREIAARQIEMLQTKELLDRSKEILSAVVEIARSKSERIDWAAIEKDTDIDKENKEEFDKVKPT